jgi:hypothetical protein
MSLLKKLCFWQKQLSIEHTKREYCKVNVIIFSVGSYPIKMLGR